jgi:simple sugar transport system ATP-binding protein
VQALFGELRALARAGKTILLVTHKLKEVMAVTDAVTVMRQGAVVAARATACTTPAELAALMIGRAPQPPARTPVTVGAPALEVEAMTLVDPDGVKHVDGVSFRVCAGEIVGIAGVAGNGQSELIEALVGLRSLRTGTIRIGGTDATSLSVSARRRLGLSHVAEDRLRLGAIAAFSAAENALLGRQDDAACSRRGLLRRAAIRSTLEGWMRAYDIRPRDPDRRLALFSGGNQQKLVVARELERRPTLLVAGQPTRGVDVGAAELIHARLLALRGEGAGILLISADLDEIRPLSDRILVMCGGRIAGEVAPEAVDERGLGLLMAGAEAA